ncbi:MAG: hypothetical protein LBH73_02425 [Spirochaetaceae bacterium]|jgi:hypothetical protein|nr:hypothetical protein [Spirochaetaceae bacterium]
MANDGTNLEILSTRSGFNSAVRQIKKTIGVVDAIGSTKNLGDTLFEMGDEDLSGEKAALLLSMVLVDKMGYKTFSSNLESVVAEPAVLAREFEKWKGVDLIVAYHHPEMGLLVANPKNGEELAGLGQLRKRELLVVYAGKGGAPADEACLEAAKIAASLFEGAKIKPPPAVLRGNFVVRKLKKIKEEAPEKPPARGPKAARKAAPVRGRGRRPSAPSAAPEAQRVAAPVVTTMAPPVTAPKGPVKMTPRYAVVVQNELFHNGNVEAWKRIVASYKAKYPQLEVFIYYDGERILDINSLFKWGKVKHGSAIEFAVAGNDIKDVAKLQRYLAQGASHMFEAFLHGPVNNVLRLF